MLLYISRMDVIELRLTDFLCLFLFGGGGGWGYVLTICTKVHYMSSFFYGYDKASCDVTSELLYMDMY